MSVLRAGAFAIALTCGWTPCLPAQTAGLRFEVATIKPADPNAVQTMFLRVHPGGRVTLSCYTLKGLISIAFTQSYWQLSGGEDWTDNVRYIVEAKAPDSIAPTLSTRHSLFTIGDDRLREMLRSLLVDRFQLRFHRATKTGTVYLLTRNPNAPLQLHAGEDAASAEAAGSIGWAERWVLFHTTMPQLAKFAADFYLHAPVLDRTDLPGAFDYKSPPEDVETYRANQTASFVGMIRQIGLKLESTKGAVDTFAIDYAAKPSPN